MRRANGLAFLVLVLTSAAWGEAEAPKWERPKTTRRYLQGPYCERLVTFWREGKLVIGENVHRADWQHPYGQQPAWGAWLVHGDGTPLDFRAAELSVSLDGAPDHSQTWREDGLDVTLAACVPFGRRPPVFARLAFANRSDRTVERTYAVLLRNGFECEMTFRTPDVYASYAPQVADWLGLPSAKWRKEKDRNLCCAGDKLVAFDGKGVTFGWDEKLGAVRLMVSLGPGETKTADFTLASGRLPDETYDAARAAMRASWNAELRGLVLPPAAKHDTRLRPLVRNLAAQMLQMLALPTDGDFVIPRQGGQQRLAWPGEAMEMCDALDRLGLGAHVDRCCAFFMDRCVQESGEAGPFRNRWVADAACVLRLFARHCVRTGNSALWRTYAEKAAKSFAWICAKREADGLFPPVKSTDSGATPMKHRGQTDVLNLAGLEWYARATETFAEANAAEAKAVARDYRAAIGRALARWRESEYFYLHAAAFADMGFLSAEEMVRVRRWLVNHGYTTWCERQWATAWTRVGRDDLARQALDAMLTFAVSDEFVVGERYHDADPWYFPWSPNASGSARIVQALFDCRPPEKRKLVIAEGHDIMNSPISEICRLRHKFAATGIDGIDFHLWGRWNGGPLERADAKDERSLREADLEEARRMLPVITSTPGLEESVLRVGLTMDRRIAWTDDARWERLADNFAFLADFARQGGIKGFAIDEEDYNKTRQFFRTEDDPPFPELTRLVRERGRQFFGAALRAFPDARINCSWLYATILKWPAWTKPTRGDDQCGLLESYGELWPHFVNGFIDVMPPETMLVEGNEERGYHGIALSNDFEVAAWETSRGILPQIAPENRRKFLGQLSVSFGSYLDMYHNPPSSTDYYHAPLFGRREARFFDNLSRMLAVADDFVWLYGERGQWIDWEIDPKKEPGTSYRSARVFGCPLWSERIPGFSRMIRIAKGDLSVLDDEVASGVFSNLVANGGCDGAKMPTDVTTWTRLKDPPQGLFGVDEREGATAPGALRLAGNGCFVVRVRDLRPGDELYLRVSARGGNPQLGVSWTKDGKYLDRHGGQKVPLPERWDHGRWYRHRLHYVVPENADAQAITFGGRATAERPNFFDDVEIFKKVK